MSASEVEMSELKEWLTNEVKLERYFEKLTNYGFSSLSLIQNLDEDDLDTVGITPPYHRKRMLRFCRELQMRQSHVKGEPVQTGNDPNELSSLTECFGLERTENKGPEVVLDLKTEELEGDPPPLPPKVSKLSSFSDVSKAKPVVPDRESSLPRQQLDYKMETIIPTTSATVNSLLTKNYEANEPGLPEKSSSDLELSTCPLSMGKDVKKARKPPPIPPRSDLDPDQRDKGESIQGNVVVCSEDSEAVKGGLADDTHVSNGQEDLKEDLGVSSDQVSTIPLQMPNVQEGGSAPRPVPRQRGSGKEKATTTPGNLASQPLPDKRPADGMVQHSENEHATESKESLEQTEEDESLYSNIDECRQAVAALPKVLEKPANKKPMPVPRKPRPKPIPPETSENIRHSIAVPAQVTNKTKEETIDTKKSKSLTRPSNFVPGLPEQDDMNTQNTSKECHSGVAHYQECLPKPVSPPTQTNEQDIYEVIVDVEKHTDSLGSYEDIKMPHSWNPPVEDIYEPIADDFRMSNSVANKEPPTLRPKDSKPREDVHPAKLLSICGDDIKNKLRNSLVVMPDAAKKKGSPEEVIYDYESDESTEGLLLEEPPEFHEERKPRGESTDSTDARQLKSTPKSRKTCGYLYKQGGQQNNRGWKKRWFVFDGKELRYYRSEENTQESLHVIPVSQMSNVEFVKEAKKDSIRFNLITANRVFMLSSDSMTDTNLWAQTLMEAIIQNKEDNSAKKVGGKMSDPDKEGWLKKQGHNVVGDWKRRYVAIKKEKICYYDTYEDFKYETPIHCVEAKLASVKQDSHRNRFLIVTPYKAFSFQAENEFEAASWISAIQTAIQMGLSDHSVINKVWSNPANKKCADCGKKDPVWASVKYCICVCAQCVGIHRSLGVRYSKPRSLLMDEKIWNEQLMELMLKIGNENANKLLEYRIPDDDKITPDSDNEKRMEFIFSKYKDMKYMKISEDYGKPEALGQSLQKAVVTDNIFKTMELLINRANVKYTDPNSEDQRTPLELAKDSGQELQAELLRQNGADAVDEPSPAVPEETLGFELINSSELPAPHASVEVPEKAGFILLMKKKYWFTLKDRNLKYFRNQGDKDPSGVIDLATVTSLELHASEDSRSLDIVTLDKTYTLKGESDEELESWHLAIRNKQVFNVLLSFQELGSDGIPHLVAHCLQFVETYGLQAEGIYRVNGNQSKIRALRQAFNQDASRVMLTLDDYSVHDVTGTLKKYLRELPDPVVPDNLYKMFIVASRNPDHDTKLYAIKDALNKLPKVNYDTLKRIIGHLKKVIADQANNRMGIENVSMIFGPTLMSNEKTGKMDDSSINQEFKIIGDLIQYYEWFFDVDDKEIEKDKLMEEARKKIIQFQEPVTKGAINQEFTLDIYVQQKNDNPCLIKVAAGMTAGEICMNIMRKKELPPETNWALFEVIGKLNLERAMQYREKVLPVVMAWEDFGDIRKDNYLIIKENHIAESVQPFVGTSLALEGQLYVREPKRKDWKLSTVILKNGYMVVDKSKSFFKSIKSDKSDNDQWSLHNLVVFLGVPVEKSTKGVDTSAGFTVVVKTDQNGNLIRYLCAKDKIEMYRWLAAILNMKHPEGIWTDPTAAADSNTRRVKDKQMYLGRQSRYLRTEGSSKHIVDEIRTRQKSLRRSVPRS